MSELTFTRAMEVLERRLQYVESHLDADSREAARSLVEAVLDVHAIGLGHLLESIRASGGESMLAAAVSDPRIAALLSMHDLNPSSVEERLQDVVDEVNQAVEGAEVAVHETDGQRAELSAGGSPPAREAAKVEVARRLAERAPELSVVWRRDEGAGGGLIPLDRLRRREGTAS